jgi:hypothetical protein
MAGGGTRQVEMTALPLAECPRRGYKIPAPSADRRGASEPSGIREKTGLALLLVQRGGVAPPERMVSRASQRGLVPDR